MTSTSDQSPSSTIINRFRGTVNGIWVRLIKQLLINNGVTNLPPLSEFNIPEKSWSSTSLPVPIEGVRQLHHWAVKKTGNPLLPVELGLNLEALDLRELGIVLWSAQNLRQRIENLVQYQALITTTTRLVFSEAGGKAAILLIDSDPLDRDVNLTDLGMMSLVAAIFKILWWELDSYLPVTLDLPFPKPEWGTELEKKLNCSINYSTNVYRIELSSNVLERPLKNNDPELLQACTPIVQRKLMTIEQENIVLKISQLLFNLSPFVPPSTAQMADTFNMSSRTFQRKLTEMGLSYRELVTKMRHEKALALMGSLNQTLTSASYELGFSDPSSFSRAFKSWTGVSPREYRQESEEPA